MASSPQVIIREIDVSTVAAAASTSIAAIVGGSTKGPVNERTFISSPDQFVETFGQPVPDSFLGYSAINFLRKGNQLWVTRVASLKGDEPYATATTDTSAEITSDPITTFAFTGSMTITIDSTTVIMSFSPTTTATISAIANAINYFLSYNQTPQLGTASVVNGNQIKIVSQTKNGPLSTITVGSASAELGLAGKFDSGERTVFTAQSLTPASVTSTNAGATINTAVTYARRDGGTYAANTLYNVSALRQEAYGSIAVSNISAFTAGVYNTGTITINSLADTDIVTINGITFELDNNATDTSDIAIPFTGSSTNSEIATLLANAINDYASHPVPFTLGIPTIGVSAVAVGNTVTLTQIDPDSSNTVSLAETGTSFSVSGATTAGGTTGQYITINVPNTYNALSYTEEKNVNYFFMAGADIDISNLSASETAASIAAQINTVWQGYGTGTYTLSATSSGSVATIASRLDAGESGNGIDVDLTNASGITANDLNSGNLLHGFDARTFAFGTITIDGQVYGIDWDDTTLIPSYIVPDVHEATLQQIVDGINYFIGSNVASITGTEALRITSPTGGTEGSVVLTASTEAPVTTYDDPLKTLGAAVAGTGDNHLRFKIDDTTTVDVYFTPSATLAVSTAVDEINAAIADVDTTLGSLASLTGNQIKISSPKSGNFAEFGSSIQVLEALTGVFTDLTFHEGTGSKVASIKISATSPGSWANDVIAVRFSDEDPLFSAPNSSRMDILLNGVIVETFRELVVNPDANGVTGVSGEGVYIETAVNGVSDFVVVDFDDNLVDTDPDTLATSVKIVANTSSIGTLPPYELSGGADGIDGLTDADVIGVTKDVNGNSTGLQTYADKEQILINLIAAPGFTSQAIGNALVTLAETREDTLALIDPPMGLNAQEIVDWHNGLGYGRTAALNTSYAALYNTWIKQYDPYNDIDINLPPSALLLAQMAFNDSVADPWFATAGLTRGRLTDALDVLSPTTLGDRELLYGLNNRVNPIPKFIQEGIVVWGNRTLYRQESALKEITVRRLLNYAKTIVDLLARTYLFDPNDTESSTRLINKINPALDNIRSRRGLTSFKVVDATTDRDRNLNRMVIKIFLQPTRTIEIIEIPMVVTQAGGSFSI